MNANARSSIYNIFKETIVQSKNNVYNDSRSFLYYVLFSIYYLDMYSDMY